MRCSSRPAFLAFVFAVSSGLPALALAAGAFTATGLADNIHLVTGPSGNTLVAVDSDGIVLVEGVPAQYADEYLAFVRELAHTDKIKTLINSHWHDDATGLNAALASKGKLGVVNLRILATGKAP